MGLKFKSRTFQTPEGSVFVIIYKFTESRLMVQPKYDIMVILASLMMASTKENEL